MDKFLTEEEQRWIVFALDKEEIRDNLGYYGSTTVQLAHMFGVVLDNKPGKPMSDILGFTAKQMIDAYSEIKNKTSNLGAKDRKKVVDTVEGLLKVKKEQEIKILNSYDTLKETIDE